jgi:hypothetical protein
MRISQVFEKELTELLNKNSQESSGANTPDFILAKYLIACLAAYDEAVRQREIWYDHKTPSKRTGH